MSNEQLLLLANTPTYFGFVVIVLEVIFIIGLLFGLAFLTSSMLSKKIMKSLKEDKNILEVEFSPKVNAGYNLKYTNKVRVAAVGDPEDEPELDHENALVYIKDTYGIDVRNNLHFIMDKAKEFRVKIDDTHKQIQILFRMSEFACINKDSIQTNVNAAGALMLYVDKELRIFLNVLYLLQKEDSIYSDNHQELIDIANHVKHQETKILRMCLTLITECSNHD